MGQGVQERTSKICGRQLLKNLKWYYSLSKQTIITSNWLKDVFQKNYLVYSLTPWPKLSFRFKKLTMPNKDPEIRRPLSKYTPTNFTSWISGEVSFHRQLELLLVCDFISSKALFKDFFKLLSSKKPL